MFQIDSAWNEMGPPGRAGVDGRDGESIVGPPGSDGSDGLSLNLKGKWQPTERYQENDVVNFDGESWAALRESKARRPRDHSPFWQLLAAKGDSIAGPRGRRGEKGDTGSSTGESTLVEMPLSEAMLDGTAVYSENGTLTPAQADDTATSVAVGLISDGKLAPEGVIERSNWTAITGSSLLSPGATYFLSADSAGKITATAPTSNGHLVVVVGHALTATKLDIEVAEPILL